MKNYAKVDFFYIFVFNCVKLWVENAFCLSERMAFGNKSVIYVTSIPIPKAPMGRGWADIHNGKRRFCTL